MIPVEFTALESKDGLVSPELGYGGLAIAGNDDCLVLVAEDNQCRR